MVPCAPGKYSYAGAATCSTCTAGWYCPDPADPSKNAPCPAGTYSPAGSARCIACPAGYYCPTQSTTTPVVCQAGRYSLGRATVCTQSPAGTYVAAADSEPLACPGGHYSNPGVTVCTLVPAGYRSASPADSPVICPAGTYSEGGLIAASCPRAWPGYWTSAGSTSPNPPSALAPDGYYYNPFANTLALTPCMAGTHGMLPHSTLYFLFCVSPLPSFFFRCWSSWRFVAANGMHIVPSWTVVSAGCYLQPEHPFARAMSTWILLSSWHLGVNPVPLPWRLLQPRYRFHRRIVLLALS